MKLATYAKSGTQAIGAVVAELPHKLAAAGSEGAQ